MLTKFDVTIHMLRSLPVELHEEFKEWMESNDTENKEEVAQLITFANMCYMHGVAESTGGVH